MILWIIAIFSKYSDKAKTTEGLSPLPSLIFDPLNLLKKPENTPEIILAPTPNFKKDAAVSTPSSTSGTGQKPKSSKYASQTPNSTPSINPASSSPSKTSETPANPSVSDTKPSESPSTNSPLPYKTPDESTSPSTSPQTTTPANGGGLVPIPSDPSPSLKSENPGSPSESNSASNQSAASPTPPPPTVSPPIQSTEDPVDTPSSSPVIQPSPRPQLQTPSNPNPQPAQSSPVIQPPGTVVSPPSGVDAVITPPSTGFATPVVSKPNPVVVSPIVNTPSFVGNQPNGSPSTLPVVDTPKFVPPVVVDQPQEQPRTPPNVITVPASPGNEVSSPQTSPISVPPITPAMPGIIPDGITPDKPAKPDLPGVVPAAVNPDPVLPMDVPANTTDNSISSQSTNPQVTLDQFKKNSAANQNTQMFQPNPSTFTSPNDHIFKIQDNLANSVYSPVSYPDLPPRSDINLIIPDPSRPNGLPGEDLNPAYLFPGLQPPLTDPLIPHTLEDASLVFFQTNKDQFYQVNSTTYSSVKKLDINSFMMPLLILSVINF